MHELSLAESMLRIVEEAAEAQGLRRVHAVTLEIGRLAAVEIEAMRFCFEAATRGSIADGARLELVEVPGLGCCASCSAMVAMDEQWMLCPHCGAASLRIVGGDRVRVLELEAE